MFSFSITSNASKFTLFAEFRSSQRFIGSRLPQSVGVNARIAKQRRTNTRSTIFNDAWFTLVSGFIILVQMVSYDALSAHSFSRTSNGIESTNRTLSDTQNTLFFVHISNIKGFSSSACFTLQALIQGSKSASQTIRGLSNSTSNTLIIDLQKSRITVITQAISGTSFHSFAAKFILNTLGNSS